MSLIWYDCLTPKQALIAYTLKKALERLGFDIFITTRDYDYTVSLLRLKGLDYVAIGSHGGASLKGKLRRSCERMLKMIDLVEKTNPRALVSFSSPDATRVAFGMGIPIINLNDSPHAEHVCRLTFSLSDYVITPKCIPLEVLEQLGRPRRGFIQYEGVDEVAWLRDYNPSPSALSRYGLRPLSYVVLRPEEQKAAYMLKVKLGFSYEDILKYILNTHKGYRIVFLPRYEDQRPQIQHPMLVMPRTAVDGPLLTRFAALVITGGGTMSREACLQGTPSISYSPHKLYVNEYLKKRGFPLYDVHKLDNIIDIIDQVLEEPARARVDTEELLKGMESPVDVVIKLIPELLETSL